MKKKDKKRLVGLLTSFMLVIMLLVLDKFNVINIEDYINLEDENSVETATIAEESEVIRVVDGDTFVIKYNGKEEKVRLIGVDTPESVHPNEEKNTQFGEEVSNFSKKMLTGKKVAIELDVEHRDKYGRLLAYVYLDGQMYNKILLEKGYAKIATYPPNVKYVEEFTEIQKQARENKVGLWEY